MPKVNRDHIGATFLLSKMLFQCQFSWVITVLAFVLKTEVLKNFEILLSQLE